MKLNSKLSLTLIGVLSAIIVVGTIYIATQNKGEIISFSVESFSPEGEVPQRQNFTVTFSHPIADTTLINQELESAPVEFSPEIPGKFRWIEPDKLRFFPEVALLPSTVYTAEISPQISPSPHLVLTARRKFTFFTQRFQVKSARLAFEYSTEKKSHAKIIGTIEFNYPVIIAEVKENLSIAYEGGAKIPYRIRGEEIAADIIELETEEVIRGENDQRIHLKIEKGFKCANGQLGLERAYITPIILRGHDDLVVGRVYTSEGGGGRYIEIRFSAAVLPEQAKLYVTLEPEVDYQLTTRYRYLQLRGDFKPGSRYTVKIKRGLRAEDDAILKRDFSTTLAIPNLEPSLRFAGEGLYLPRDGNLNLGLATINVDRVQIEIEKVYANNLIYLASAQNWRERTRNLGTSIHSEELAIQSVLNEEVTTPILLKDYLSDDHIGIFKVTARELDRRWRRSVQWVMITDLGVMAKQTRDELWVWVNSLSSLKPIANVKIELISHNNQTLLSGTTNGDGVVKFQSISEELEDFTPFMITAAKGNDLSFMELSRRQLPTGDFDVTGAPYLDSGYEAFIYTERGVYRPGEVANLAGIVRGRNTATPPPFPVLMQVLGPDQRIMREFRAQTDGEGACEFSVPLPEYVKTGGYTAKLLVANQEIGRTLFQVEAFMPDRIKVKLEADKPAYDLGDEAAISVEAVNLFGPPAAGRKVVASCDIEAENFSPKSDQWRSFTFANEAMEFQRQHIDLGESRTDENGKAAYLLTLPIGLKSPSALRGVLVATVSEPGGRAVSAYQRITIHPYSHYIGIRRRTDGYAKINEETTIEYIDLDKAGAPTAERSLELTVYKLYWNSILRRDTSRGGYRYVSEKQAVKIESHPLTSTAGIGTFVFTPTEYGEYRIEVTDVESGASTSTTFYATGWGYSPWAMVHPDRLEINLDKASYRPGEVAKAQIKAPFSGKLILTIEREKVLHYQVVTMKENTAVIDIPVRAEYKPNAYISASLLRSTKSLEKHAPARAFGVVPLKLNTEANRLTVALDAPEKIRPNREVEIAFRVTDASGRGSTPTQLTIAAVDEGILQLTNFQTPDPHGYFFRQRGLGVDSYDLYSAILPEVEAAKGKSSTGGDGVDASRKKRLSTVSVTRVKPVSLWSGIVTTDASGRGIVRFDIPQFNGRLRLMAVAFSGDRFGSAEGQIIVRDPIVLTPTFPRFVSGGDRVRVPVSVFNGTGAPGDFEIELRKEGYVEIVAESRQTVHLETEEEGQIFFDFAAYDAMGQITFNLSAVGNDESAQIVTNLPLRPAAPPVTQTGYGVVAAGQPADFIFPSNFIQGTTEFTLTLSPFPAVKFAGGLRYLLSYPYGCIEQTTSKVFPLLYFDEIARLVDPELFQSGGADYFISEGIAKLENMLMPSGYFSYWPGGSYLSHWSSIYAAHFLVEARKAGYQISDRVYNAMLEGLRHEAKQDAQGRYETQRITYACYVLAAAGHPEKSTMLYLKNNRLNELSDYSQFQLAGAFALSGDLNTALSLLPSTIAPRSDDSGRESGGNFNSSVRAQAIMLDVLAEVNENHPAIPKLVKNLSDAASKNNRWYTTQENGFAFLALGKMLKKQMRSDYTGQVLLNGQRFADFDSKEQRYSDKIWGGSRVQLSVEGTGNCYYYWTAFGVLTGSFIDEFDKELQVRRRYLSEAGKPIDDGVFKHGDLLVAEITVKALTETLENVVVVDILPAGFEIENPRLESRAGIPWISEKGFRPDYMDIRDDRLIFFGKFPRQQEQKFYYALRAVTRGDFVLPPVAAEAMYDPTKSSVASSGKIRVVE
ncbi:MAG: MG2 domain-containing protein [Candidatus Poribacteria bacterium]|nr:MG2 domain-containing protein [Candidatus Poribacteria bacterium]